MENIEGKLIDLIDGKLSPAEKADVEKLMAQDAAVRLLYDQLKVVIDQMNQSENLTPQLTLRHQFDRMLQEEIRHDQSTSRQVFFQPMVWRMAAGIAFVMLAFGIWYWLNANYQQQQQIARLQQQMDSTKRAMIGLLTNQQSASQRMLGTTVAFQMSAPDNEILNALFKTMNEDPNTNVRLAALEALEKFKSEIRVRQQLIQSLSKQTDPVVQITLIQLLVEMREKSVVNELEKITKQKEVLKAVKDEAYSGILKLS